MAPLPGSQQPSPQQVTNTIPAVPEPDWIGTGTPANPSVPGPAPSKAPATQAADPVNLAPSAYQNMYGASPQTPASTTGSSPQTAPQSPAVASAQPAEDEFTKSLKGTQEYKMQEALNKPIFDLYEKQKQQESQKVLEMQQFLDKQSKEDSFMVQNEIQSITSSRDENIQLLKAQKEAELAIADEDRKYRVSNIEKAKQEAMMEADLAILDQNQKNLAAEKRARTALGLTGGFGSVARIEEMEGNLQDGNKIISNLRISKAKLSEKFAMDADQIQRDHTKGMLDVMFRYDTHLASFRKEAEDDIRAVQKQALLTKQQKQEKYLQIKEKYYENIDEIEGETATLMSNMNKTVYTSILDAQKAEIERKEKEEIQKWARAMQLIETYGGQAGAPFAEKVLGLPEGALPRSQTLDEVKAQLQFLQLEQEKAFQQARFALDQERFSLEQGKFKFEQYKYDQESSSGSDIYSSGGSSNGGGSVRVGSAPLNMNWSKIPANIRGNCVFFARSLVPDLPTTGGAGLTEAEYTIRKRKIINSKIPVPGSIAVMPERGGYGHVAYVESVNSDGTITIVDANDAGGAGMIGKAQVLAAGGSGVGGTPGIRRKIIDPKRYGVEGYFVGKGNLNKPSKFTQLDKGEQDNSKNRTDKTPPQKPNILSDLSKAFGLPDLGSFFSGNQQSQPIPDESGFDDFEAQQFEPQGSFADQVFELTNNPAVYDPKSTFGKQLKGLPVDMQNKYLEGLKAKNKPATSPMKNKPATSEERLTAGFANSLKSADDNLNKFDNYIQKQNVADAFYQKTVPNFMKSTETQQIEQAQRQFINALLRRESGASIAPQEFENYAQQFFPQPGDGPQVIAQKKANRKLAIQNMQKAAGSAYGSSSNSSTGASSILSKYGIK